MYIETPDSINSKHNTCTLRHLTQSTESMSGKSTNSIILQVYNSKWSVAFFCETEKSYSLENYLRFANFYELYQ